MSIRKRTDVVFQNTTVLPLSTSTSGLVKTYLMTDDEDYDDEIEVTTSDFNSTDYEDYDDGLNDAIFSRIKWSMKTVVTILAILLVLVIYKNISMKRKNKTFDSLSLKHLIFSIVHTFLIDLPAKDEVIRCDSLSTELLCVLEISIPMWTMCVALKMFTDLYLFMGREEVYSTKDFTVFGFSSIVTLHIYELFFITLGTFMSEEVRFPSAIRLTSVLLTIAVPTAVACVIIKSLCTESDMVKTIGMFFLLHLVVFILCDVCLVWFIIVETTSRGETVMVAASTVLYCRLVMEIIWFVGSHFLGKTLRIYGPN